jgi:hypothetical protein
MSKVGGSVMRMDELIRKAAIVCLSLIAFERSDAQRDVVLLQNLSGNWLFSIGINEEWKSPKFNDSEWESIKVPSPWEDQGYYGYNGYAFYRKNVTIPSAHKGRMLYLFLGYIDDVDEVYLNGHKIGSTGSFPPQYNTAYNAERRYYMPEELIKFDGTNLIAVKVYDSQQSGGIVGGNIGIYGGKTVINLDINLHSTWKFKTGDNMQWKEADFDDSDWGKIFVPGKWEDQGYRNYDGMAWYRKSIVYSGMPDNESIVLLLGKIDDIDQVYINGTLVGSTGTFSPRPQASTMEWEALRGYYIPDGVLKKNQKNVIAVRVYDARGNGGIYEGPVGFITQSKYIEYWKKLKKSTGR